MLDKVINLIESVGEKWLTVGGFFVGLLVGGIILMLSVKSARSRDEENPFAEWDEEEGEQEKKKQ